jgi:hypothetical protein
LLDGAGFTMYSQLHCLRTIVPFVAALACAAGAEAWAAPPVKRARPPKFSKSINDAFFPDASEKLVGPPPARVAGPSPERTAPPHAVPPANVAASERQWAKLLSAEVIEDEVKLQQRRLADSVKNAARFKSGDYKQARLHLGMLAALFAIDARYDQPMRWQRDAPAARDLAAKASTNCKVGTDASYREAKQAADDIEGLIRGGSMGARGGEQQDWSKVVDRSLLMKRLEQAFEQALKPGTADPGQFSRQADSLAHESQLVAALAEIMQGQGYEFADDDTYRQYAGALQTQALAIRDAIENSNADAARQAVGEASKACADCHEGYRN